MEMKAVHLNAHMDRPGLMRPSVWLALGPAGNGEYEAAMQCKHLISLTRGGVTLLCRLGGYYTESMRDGSTSLRLVSPLPSCPSCVLRGRMQAATLSTEHNDHLLLVESLFKTTDIFRAVKQNEKV